MDQPPATASDADILTLIDRGDLLGWEKLYDKYSPVLYGLVCKHFGPEDCNAKFSNIFVQLRRDNLPKNLNGSLCLHLILSTLKLIRKQPIAEKISEQLMA